ncbi:syntaxin-112-like [Ananas comosus]|uniref:Syntaxin-112-like n=1 Tax=Ananas comosus TaxID=4615 RepID=A0A6P5EZM0_ANACO|nr:syntaxin-112-like [Ananas comosus]
MNNLMTKSFLDYVELKKQAMVIEGSGASPEASADLEAKGGSPPRRRRTSPSSSPRSARSNPRWTPSPRSSPTSASSTPSLEPRLLPALRHGDLRDRVDSDVAAILRTVHSIKAQLEALDDSNAANRTLSPRFAAGTSVDRTRVSVTHGIRAKLRDAILSDHKETLKQNYYNATGELASDKVLEEMLKWRGDSMDPPWSSPGAAAPSAPASTSPPPRTSSRATS